VPQSSHPPNAPPSFASSTVAGQQSTASQAAVLSQLRSMDPEALGRLFATQNPDVLQQLAQMLTQNRPSQ
jgi:hypothetical protein